MAARYCSFSEKASEKVRSVQNTVSNIFQTAAPKQVKGLPIPCSETLAQKQISRNQAIKLSSIKQFDQIGSMNTIKVIRLYMAYLQSFGFQNAFKILASKKNVSKMFVSKGFLPKYLQMLPKCLKFKQGSG